MCQLNYIVQCNMLRKCFNKILERFLDVLQTDCFLEIALPTTLHLVLPVDEEIAFVDHCWNQPSPSPTNTSFVRQKWEEGYEVDSLHSCHWGDIQDDGFFGPNKNSVAGHMRALFGDSFKRQGITPPRCVEIRTTPSPAVWDRKFLNGGKSVDGGHWLELIDDFCCEEVPARVCDSSERRSRFTSVTRDDDTLGDTPSVTGKVPPWKQGEHSTHVGPLEPVARNKQEVEPGVFRKDRRQYCVQRTRAPHTRGQPGRETRRAAGGAFLLGGEGAWGTTSSDEVPQRGDSRATGRRPEICPGYNRAGFPETSRPISWKDRFTFHCGRWMQERNNRWQCIHASANIAASTARVANPYLSTLRCCPLYILAGRTQLKVLNLRLAGMPASFHTSAMVYGPPPAYCQLFTDRHHDVFSSGKSNSLGYPLKDYKVGSLRSSHGLCLLSRGYRHSDSLDDQAPQQPQRVHRGVHDCVAFLRRGIRIQNLAVFAETLGTAASHCDSPSPCGFRKVNADAVLCCYLLQIGLEPYGVWILALLGTGLDI
ncbi:hypothetical protein B0H13DRAFT_1872645 [Mycena leptocephala]|nr:hypothetical protein B0H13DRAFT_1872645 [Mycena leptocephala]